MNYCNNLAVSQKPPANPAKAALLCGVSFIAWGIVVGRPAPANAQMVTANAVGPIITQNDVSLYIDPNVVVTGAGNAPAVSNAGSITAPTISNQGTLTAAVQSLLNLQFGTIGFISNRVAAVISGQTAIFSQGTIGALSNLGTLTGTQYGVRNYYTPGSTIGTISNFQTIAGGTAGLENYNQIGTVNNSGDISGDAIAAVLNFATMAATIVAIATLTNSGDISSSGGFGVYNDGTVTTIATLANMSGATIIGQQTGIDNGGTIGMLSNSGLIASTNAYGIRNIGISSIGTLTNLAGGTITGNGSGILNSGTITALTNAGFIFSAVDDGIDNDGGTFGALTNLAGGTIASSNNVGLTNYDVIDALTNGGLISSALSYGIYNDGSTIGTLTNLAGGTITAHATAIENVANIGTFTNSGVIVSTNNVGIYNDETIGTFANLGGTITSSGSAIKNSVGLINTFTNSGVIKSTSEDAIDNDRGTIQTLTNSGIISALNATGVYNYEGTIGVLADLAGGTIEALGTAVYNYEGVLNTLTNGGVISSTAGPGFTNYEGTIATVANLAGGTIVAYSSGIYNEDGVIDTLTNSGVIASTDRFYGVDNYYGTIGILTNEAGATISAVNSGIINYNLIGTLTNSGLISGDYGIDNDAGAIAIITNNAGATIAARYTGIYNDAAINTLTNGGLISAAGNEGIYNDGPISILTNLAGGTIASYESGIHNDNTIGVLTNGGLISSAGDYGIDNSDGTIGTFTNLAGGTIASLHTAIYNSGGTIGVLTNGGLIDTTDDDEGIYNLNGTIGVLTNLTTGTIISSSTGIYNETSTIGTLINAGLIDGPIDWGIYNTDLIGTLTNLAGGTISGGYSGIYNDARINTLTNGGIISSSTDTGVENDGGFIGTLTNLAGGTIIGATTGVYNNATITTLTNAGLISGLADTGIGNAEGTIGAITNLAGGTISGATDGILNSGFIGAITNNGLISGVTVGIQNNGTISQITNTGTISGLTGIFLTGGGTDIFNAGTIASTDGGNAIFFGGLGNLTLSTGSDIIGNIAATGTANQITLEGSGSLDTDIVGFGPGAALAVTPGAAWAGSGNWDIPIVTNDGTFQGGHLGTPLTLTGDYLQNADGTLQVLVTPTQSTQLNVAGTATLAGGVTYLLPPGHYLPHVYPYLTASVINGGFTSINYGDIPTGFATTDLYGDPTENFVITRAFYLPNIVNPTGSAIFSAQSQALAQSADADTSSLLSKATLGGAVSSPACAAEESLTPNQTSTNGVTKTAQMASTLANVFCGAGGWIEATGSLNHASNSGGATSYNANTGGFLAGIDKVLNAAGTRIGVAIGYERTSLTDKLGDGGAMDTTRVALYAAQPIGPFALAGVLAYGNASDTTSRATAIGNLGSSNHESIFSGGAQLSTMMTMQNINIQPAAGLRIARVDGGKNFSESATGIAAAYAITGKSPSYTSVQPFLLLSASESFVTGSGMTVTPNAQIGVEYEAADRGVATPLTTANGFTLDSPHNSLDPEDALVSLGITAGKANWSLFATYTGRLSGNWNSQSAAAGVRVRF